MIMKTLAGRLTPLLLCAGMLLANEPDTTINRYATAEDAVYWHNVNEGDYLFFQGNSDSGAKIYSSSSKDPINLPIGGKILLYTNAYERIYISGAHCQNTEEIPTVITNFGGQVRWGESLDANQYRGLELVDFDYVHLTGKYDPEAQTGHPDYRGHDAGRAFDSGDYYEKYGLWGYMKWSGPRADQGYGNIVRAYRYKSLKIDYVASWGGGFASFNLKTDGPSSPQTVKVDVQDTFSGLGEGEGFYISYSTAAEGQDATQLILRNNIIVLTGAEGLQTDNLAPGSIIENNVVFGTGRFYRMPFQGLYQDNAHQFSFVAGDVTVRNNIVFGTTGYLIAPRYRDAGDGRFTPSPDESVVIENNYYGHGQDSIGYVWQGDGVTPLLYVNNVFGDISVPTTDDSRSDSDPIEAFINFGNDNSPITLRNNLYPPGANFYRFSRGSGANVVEDTGNQQVETAAPTFVNTGFGEHFDPRRIAFYTPTYINSPGGAKDGQAVPYRVGDIVYTYDESGETLFFECLQDHAGDIRRSPLRSIEYWAQMTWNGRPRPPFDLRVKQDTYYNYRKMGTTYNPENQFPADFEPPIITLGTTSVNFTLGSDYVELGAIATDNLDGDISDHVTATWVGPAFDGDTPGTYLRRYEVEDRAGNAAIPVEREVTVSDPVVTVIREIKVNLHRNGPANLSDWTDCANDTEGIRLSGAPTNTTLYDATGAATGAELLIENIPGGYSEHYKNHVNAAGVEIGEFPPEVTKNGLRIRDPHENPCVLVFSGLNSGAEYDVLFTGYDDSATSMLDSTLQHEPSGKSASVDIYQNTSSIGRLAGIYTTSTGGLDLTFTTQTFAGRPNISGIILKEKSGRGEIGAHPHINGLTSQTVPAGASSQLFTLELVDADTSAASLTLDWFSSEPDSLPASSITETGSGSNRTVTLDASHLSGTFADVTFVVSDGDSYYAQTIRITLSEDYTQWARSHFGDQVDQTELEASVWGADANPDHDAFSNALERAFLLDPQLPEHDFSPFSFAHSSAGEELSLSLNPILADGSWELQKSPDLETWEDITDDLEAPFFDGLRQIHRYRTSIGPSDSHFYRFVTNPK